MYTIKLTSVTYTMYTYEQVAAKIHDEKDPACLSLKAGSSWVDLSFTLWLPCLDMEVAIVPLLSSVLFPLSTLHAGALMQGDFCNWGGKLLALRATAPCHVLSSITQL